MSIHGQQYKINSNLNNIMPIKALDFFWTKIVPFYPCFFDTKETQEDRAFTESRILLLRSVF